MRQPTPILAPDGFGGGGSTRPARRPARAVPGGQNRLAMVAMDQLPLAVAVLDRHCRLLYWNQQAASLFAVPSLLAADLPPLATVLGGIPALTATQRDSILAFAAAGMDETATAEPETCLRLSLNRQRRLALQMRTLGGGQWMLIASDGSLADPRAALGASDAWVDALTGLSNRRHLLQTLREYADNPDSRHALLAIDIDRFAAINESYGHAAGDALLCVMAQRLRRETRDDDLLARPGGDEMVVLIRNGEHAESLAARLVESLSRPYAVDGNTVQASVSIGIARFPDHGQPAETLMHHADLALYDAKSAGRRTCRVFGTEMAVRVEARQRIETDLRQALTLGELALVYQPQRRPASPGIIGFEALPRWNHAVRGDIGPADFLPIAEASGVIVALGEWMLKTACQDAVAWPGNPTVAVNVSPRQLEPDAHLEETVQAALRSSGLPADRLELEIAGSTLLSGDNGAIATLQRLREMRIGLVMDGFGTGGASLGHLRAFPFSKIKIDAALVAELGRGQDAAAVIGAIAALGQGLGASIVAEGIQTQGQADLIAAGGCAVIQGDVAGVPMQAIEIAGLLAELSPQQDEA